MGWFVDIVGAALFAAGIAGAIGHAADGTGGLTGAILLILLGGAVRAAGQYAAHATAIAGARGVVRTWRLRLFPHLLGGRLASPIPAGESAVLAIDHLTTIEAYEARFRPIRTAAAGGPILVLLIVTIASPVAGAILLGTLIPFIFGMVLAGTAARRASERQVEALAALSGLFVDRIRTLPIIRHFGAEERIARQVTGATREVADRTVAVLRTAFLSGAILEFFAALSVALVAVYCGFSLLGLLPFRAPEHLTLRHAFFALAMAPEFYLPMRRLAAAYHEKQLGEAALAKLDAIDAPTPPPPPGDIPAGGRFDGLRVRGLTLAWPGLTIGPVAFDLGARDCVAVTGPTGSGKTSLLAAIAGQIVATEGSIVTVSGRPLDPADIAWAAQVPLLLPGTLGENIALARPDASPRAIEAVARQVGLGPMLAARDGLGLQLDHRGSGLSGGERRRIGLARAILSGRPLLMCDEPTADLDEESAGAIVALLADLARERALLIATHDPRLAAIARMDIAL